jgi:hypothetical protein
MLKFIKYIVGGVLAILIVMSVLDVVYTKIYETAYPRTKFQYLRSLKNQKVHYIFLGSSRVENGIVPAVVEEKTGKIAVNFGFQAAKLGDIYTILQLIHEYNISYETILIQVDYIYNFQTEHSNILEFEMVPFVRDNAVTKKYCNTYSANFVANYYLPFYRYCSNDLKLGFREVFANAIHKKTNVVANKGYGAKYGHESKLEGALPATIIATNGTMNTLLSYVKQHDMKVVFYCAPFCENIHNKEYVKKLKNKIPGFYDFSGVITDNRMFQNCNHLNDEGARRFTEILTQTVFVDKNTKP